MQLRYGACTDCSHLEDLAAAGYDYIELKLSKLASAAEAVFRQMVARVDASPLKAETYNCFFRQVSHWLGKHRTFPSFRTTPDGRWTERRAWAEKLL